MFPEPLNITMSYSEVGKSWNKDNIDGFRTYVKGINTDWAKGITLHHTASPNLANRPNGLTDQHIRNIMEFYKGKGWSRGPHLFIDDKRIMAMSPMSERGIHAASFNSTRIGIEVLGEYDSESPHEGRGLEAWKLCMQAVKVIGEESKNFNPQKFNFHRNDPKTSKTCPGKLVTSEFLDELLLLNGTSPVVTPKEMPQQASLSKLGTVNVFKRGNELLVPIAETLISFGIKNADTSKGSADVYFYDLSTKTSYAKIDSVDDIFNNLS